ncbi:MAG: Phosphoserine phosphatase [Deltaproteobacteria bacterium]|jgi:phosphoserine phosphatase|nr:Phosphoserine phosphatase [Deltaproteobacteria bacterium]
MSRTSLRLAFFDLDGTIRRVRDPWVHLHEFLGVAEQARDLIPRWRRGEITYDEWARLDAALWRGVLRTKMMAALHENPVRRGARELVGWFTSKAIPCVGISTGLSIFHEHTARDLGMDRVICNELHFDGDVCTGEITINVREGSKGEIMDEVLAEYGVRAEEAVAFGDGKADIPLFSKAGLGIAICPVQDQVRESAHYVVEAEPIDGALEIVASHFSMDRG